MKKNTLFILVFILSSCHQESFILLRNLDRAEWLTAEQILKESGIYQDNITSNSNRISRSSNTPPQQLSIPQESRYMTVPANKEFIVQLSGDNTLITLKSTSGGITYLKDRSDPEQKLFAFQAKETNGRAHFQYYSLDGILQKNLYYYFNVTAPIATTPPSTNIATRKPQLSTEETNTATNTVTTPKNKTPVEWFLTSVRKLPPSEAIKNLENALIDTTFSETDKETLSYELIENYLKQRLYSRASNRIEALQDATYQAYYRGLYYEALQKPAQALEYLLIALNAGGSIIPKAVIATERVMLTSGVSDISLISQLDSLTATIKDTTLKAEALYQLARLYEQIRNTKRARELYQSILSESYPKTWKTKAQEALSILTSQFQ